MNGGVCRALFSSQIEDGSWYILLADDILCFHMTPSPRRIFLHALILVQQVQAQGSPLTDAFCSGCHRTSCQIHAVFRNEENRPRLAEMATVYTTLSIFYGLGKEKYQRAWKLFRFSLVVEL